MIDYVDFKTLKVGGGVLVTSWGECFLAHGKVTKIISYISGIVEVEITSLDLTGIDVESVIGAKEAFGNKNLHIGQKREFRADLEIFKIYDDDK